MATNDRPGITGIYGEVMKQGGIFALFLAACAYWFATFVAQPLVSNHAEFLRAQVGISQQQSETLSEMSGVLKQQSETLSAIRLCVEARSHGGTE